MPDGISTERITNMSAIKTIVVSLLIGTFAPPAYALPVPFKTEGQPQYAYAKRLYGYARVDTDISGKPVLKVEFSNSRRWEGQNGVGVLVKLMAGSDIVQVISVQRDMGDPLFRGTRKASITRHIELDAQTWASVTDITYQFDRHVTTAQMKDLEKLHREHKGPADSKFKIKFY
jgi:hypothetical protein